MAAAVRELPTYVALQSHRPDRKNISSGAVAVDRLLRVDRPERDQVQRGVSQGNDREALEEIREQNPAPNILLVADSYGSHHAKLTQERAKELGIMFVFIPLY